MMLMIEMVNWYAWDQPEGGGKFVRDFSLLPFLLLHFHSFDYGYGLIGFIFVCSTWALICSPACSFPACSSPLPSRVYWVIFALNSFICWCSGTYPSTFCLRLFLSLFLHIFLCFISHSMGCLRALVHLKL